MKNFKISLVTIIAFIALYPVQGWSQLQSDVSDAVWSIVMPLAESQDIDMKQCLVGKVKDSLVSGFIRNTGSYEFQVDSIYFRGLDANAFGLVSGFPQFIVASGTNHFGEFRFKPSTARLYTAEIVIITQADTIIQKIKGEGIQPKVAVMANIIDFGLVNIGSHKDSIQALTIKNIGSSPLTITSTKHNKPNDYDFKTLSGGAPFTINPGDTWKMDLQFMPSDIGRTSGMLEFYFNGVGSPALIQLFGEGVRKSPIIQTNIPSQHDLICENSITEIILISNKGGNPLIINSMNLKGNNNNEFSILEKTPITLEPDSTKKINITFNPKTIGQKTVDLEINSNSYPDSITTIPIIVKKDSVSLIPQTTTINLGYLCPNETKDSNFIITNTGTLLSGGFAKYSSKLKVKNNTFIINSGSDFNFPFSFSGNTNEGIFSETITVIDSICGFSRKVLITGEVVKPIIDADSLTVTALIGTVKDDKITIRNNSKRDFTIENSSSFSSPFELIGNPFPIFVPINGIAEIPIKYTPADEINDTLNVMIDAKPCTISKSISIIGLPSKAMALLQSGNISGFPGDTIVAPIILKSQKNLLLSGATSLITNLNFNSTLLLPIDIISEKIDMTTSKIKLENLPVNKSIGDTLTKVRFIVGLGNSDGCDLALSNTNVVNGIVDISVYNGHFTLLGICPEGGKRLINPTGKIYISSIKPNPSDNEITVELNLVEKTGYKLSIVNTNGQIVREISKENSNKGRVLENIGISDLSSGVYNLILQTESENQTKLFLIVK